MTRSADSLPHAALSARAHNREALHRTDDDWLASRWADPATRVLVVAAGQLRPVDGDPARGVTWVAPADAPDGIRVLLGERDGLTRFAVLLDEVPEGETWVPLRGLFEHLAAADADGAAEAAWLFHAVGLAEWHRATRFCPRCGGGLRPGQAGHELACESCGRRQFPRTDPAVIMAIRDDDDRLLLGRSPSWPAGRWSTLAGFVEPGETFEDAVRREVFEEAGIVVGEVDYVANQPWPLPASVMIGFTGRAVTTDIDVDGAEIEQARWFTREELRTECEAGRANVPRTVSISSSLIELWYGGPLPGAGRW